MLHHRLIDRNMYTVHCTEFAITRTQVVLPIRYPADIFTAELTALFGALRHIGKVIQYSEKCLILTDSLSSVEALLFRKISH
jgi:hypothetical protein